MLTEYHFLCGLRMCPQLIKITIMLKTIGGMAINLASSAFNHNLAERSAQKQYNRQLEFWRLQNDYNNPSAQRARMERAGFNPALIAGDVAGNNVAGELSNVPGNQLAQNGTINLEALNQSLQVFGQLEKLGADTQMMRRQIELSFIDEIIKNGEAYGIKLDNEQKQILLQYLATEKDVSLAEAMSRINELNTRSDKNVAEAGAAEARADESRASAESIRALIEPTKNNLMADTKYKESLATWNTELLQFEKDLKSAQTQQAKATAANQWSQSKLANITASLEEKYGDRNYAAKVTSAEAAAEYAYDLQQQAVKVAETTAMLNENNAMTNDARVAIEQAAQDLKERAFGLEENKFQLEAVKAATDATIKIIDAATPW